MLRMRILMAAAPLVVVAVSAGGTVLPHPDHCLTIGDTAVELAPASWPADLRLAFTDDPAGATVRVGLVDDPSTADLAVVDDGGSAAPAACRGPSLKVAIDPRAAAPASRIHVSRDPDAAVDLRVYVESRNLSPQQAAVLLVAARAGHPHPAAPAL
jgi:hypothetical protein